MDETVADQVEWRKRQWHTYIRGRCYSGVEREHLMKWREWKAMAYL